MSRETMLIKKFPRSKVTGLSNSHSQKAYIETQAENKGLKNLVVLTGDVNEYEFTSSRFLSLKSEAELHSFDRALSIEMFEHMKNYEFLLKKVSIWLRPDGKLFVHIFCHKSDPYDMEEGSIPSNWLTQAG